MKKENRIYALGFFDGVHLGHQALLKACRELARQHGCTAGAVTFTAHPETLVTGSAPALINTAADRRWLLQAYGMASVVELPFDRAMMTLPWEDFVAMLRTGHGAAGFVCGDDFRFGYRGEGTARKLGQLCAEASVPFAMVPEQTEDGIRVSSTHIRGLLEAGDVEAAARFLGHPHILSGTVVSGRQLGRTIGIPTANLALPPEVAALPHGVYACLAHTEMGTWPAVTNVGTRPTVNGSHVTVEPWLLDFSGDLYGTRLRLEFHRFLRPERKFPSLEELRAEIQKNAAQVREFFEKT